MEADTIKLYVGSMMVSALKTIGKESPAKMLKFKKETKGDRRWKQKTNITSFSNYEETCKTITMKRVSADNPPGTSRKIIRDTAGKNRWRKNE